MHRYFPHTPAEIEEMLGTCGLSQLADLYSDVPSELKLKAPYKLPAEMGETEVREFFNCLGARNADIKACFAGGGFYDHYVPAAAASLISRSEFLTAYTPYQPEISQGTLQYIFEYQSMMCALTGMEVSNASIYDGATATAEAVNMAVASARRRKRVLLSATVAPAVAQVLATYASGAGIVIEVIPEDRGTTSIPEMEKMLGAGDVAAVVLSQPNYYGIVEDYSGVADKIHAAKALMILNSHASPLGVLRTPAEWGADIACGEAQSLGMPLNYGGPGLGYLCCRKSLMRKLPGRVVGATTDREGRRCFVLTLQAREQHIRRQKATSNICSNQSLMALYATIYLALMGKEGMKEVNRLSCDGAHYLYIKLIATGKFEPAFPGKPFLKEFTLRTKLDMAKVNEKLLENGFRGPLGPGDGMAEFAVTEKRTREEIDRLVEIISKEA